MWHKFNMIWLILFLALLLRLINLNQSLWWDEAINVVYARSNDFWWFITKYPIGDFHPPGWFAVLWGWGHFFNFSEISIRVPSVIFGSSTVYLVYLLGRDLFNRKIGLLAAFFLSVAPLHVYFSQEARMYAYATFSVTLSFYFLNRKILNKKWGGLGYFMSLLLILSSDYVAYLVIPAQIIYFMWLKKLQKQILAIFLTAFIIFLPWFSIFPTQLKAGINTAASLPGWGQVVGSSFKDLLLIPVKTFFGKITFSNNIFYIILSGLTAIVFGGLFFRGLKKIDQSTKLLICWILIPVILAFLISFFIPIMAYFRMLFILPAVYLLLALGLNNLSRRFFSPAVIIICLISILSLLSYYLNPKFQREDWRGAVNFISKNLDSQTIVLFENTEVPAPIKYYSSNLSNHKPGISQSLKDDLAYKNKVFLFEYLVDVYDPKRMVEKNIQEMGFLLAKTYDFSGVGFIKMYVK